MNIVVTGSSGMVGMYLKHYIENNFKNHNFIFLNKSKNDEFSIDLTNRNDVLNFFSKHKFDYIIHLAANVGGLFKNLRNNTKIFTENIRMNENILEACHLNNIQRGIFCLSSCIYPSNPSSFPMNEQSILESSPHPSNRGYAYAKRMMYVQCQNYNNDFGREYICIAPVNMYGKYDNFNLENAHFIPALLHRFYKKELLAYGTGKPLRQMIYAEDVAEIICILLFNINITKNIDLINLSNDKEDTIKNYVNTLAKSMNIDSNTIKWDSTKSDGCLKKTISNTVLKQILPDYKFTSFEKGIKQTYEWFLNNYDTCRK